MEKGNRLLVKAIAAATMCGIHREVKKPILGFWGNNSDYIDDGPRGGACPLLLLALALCI